MNNRKRKTLFFLVILLIAWSPLFYGAFDKDKPAASTSLRNSNPEILANWAALESAIAQDHEFSTGGTNSGKHEVITFEEESSAGASSTNEGHLQVIDGGSQPEMAFTSEDGDQLQFTKDGDLFSSDGLVVTEASTFNGSINLGAGDDLLLSTTSDITISGNTFTVAGATGNTVIAGTLGVTGATEVTGVATLGDGSLLKTSAAPSTDAMIANKKYVDDIDKNIVILTDEKAQSTNGGTFTSGAWRKRTVTEQSDTQSLATVSSSVIVLAAGTYHCRISCPAFEVLGHVARLQNTTGATTLVIGTAEFASTANIVQNRSFIEGIFTVAASQNLEIQHRCNTTKTTSGFGVATNLIAEVYTIATFKKIG